MRRTTPDLAGRRKAISSDASIALLVLISLYVLWTNYVVFVGGSLPLTHVNLGQGSVGAGLALFPIGDTAITLLLWLVLDGLVLSGLRSMLRSGSSRSRAPRQRV